MPEAARRALAAGDDPRPRAAAVLAGRPPVDLDRTGHAARRRERGPGARRTTSRAARSTGRAGARAGPRAGPPARRSPGTGGPSGSWSSSFQPAPTPTSIRPPLIWSTVVTSFTKLPGMPERDRADQRAEARSSTSRARGRRGPPRRRSSGWSVAPGKRGVVVAPEERLEARRLGPADDRELVLVRTGPAGPRSSARSASVATSLDDS